MNDEHVYDAIVLGAGFGGLGAGAQLMRTGITDFLILERCNDIGGVWRDNIYPGAACDTQSVIYCYSYFLNLSASSMYAGQSELYNYLKNLASEFDLNERIRLGLEVTEARWDEATDLWEISTISHIFYTRVFIPAWGQLGTPNIPDIPGAETFAGLSFHSARWDTEVDLQGAKVGSIGNAASAVQYVPELARTSAEVVVFQRSANYILPRNQIAFTPEQSAGFQRDPETYRRIRDDIHRQREDGFDRVRHHTGAQEAGANEARAHLESQVIDPQMREKLTPNYEFGCKRILRSDDYYPALTRANVELETDPIKQITETGIITDSGRAHELDAIVYGTGFDSQTFNGTTAVIGRDGVTLGERWGDDPEAFLGMAVDGFPNMFLVYGPNTNLNHNSVISMLEAQHDYIARAADYVKRQRTALEVRTNVLRKFNRELQAELQNSAYASECSSWYKNAAGKVINNWSGTVEEYVNAASLNLADYTSRSAVHVGS
ncbi:flavin-containing monooxygenase [Brevibacterium sp. UCMA 11754]|uniref:flavin-containing monooxygenase n=1 Tax=Brevibacterium sp. UCMA 11754 TaxID=2749198 RepID=UPI001F1A2186|nr:NAD(P)/FAD-dependent oxidoreductase [Brevibacterium sp. UCMA 11754]MCF2571146.1 NAD(P)/FAD-dependent oxidoreductase [Brevibacterium sp. UCMA 11754]